MRRFALLCVVMAMVAAACSQAAEPTSTTAQTSTTTTSTTSTTTTTPVTTTTTLPPDAAIGGGIGPRPVAAFATFEEIPLLIEGRYAGPSRPSSIDGIYLPEWWASSLEGKARDALEQQGFVVIPGDWKLLHPMYQTYAYNQGEVYFVTTDAGYHFLHLAFSKLLRDLEQQELLPVLEDLLTGLVEDARAQRDQLAGTDLADGADRVAQLYEAAAVLADLDVGSIGPLAQQEVDLGREAAQLIPSPITGLGPGDPEVSMEGLVDYSLFKPRGHYTRNAELERYFRAMSLLGNENFVVGRGDTMLLGALATRVLTERPDLVEAWTLIYEPTAFLVGIADDYTPFELAEQLDALAPGWRDDPTLLNEDIAAGAGEALIDLRPVGIDPEAASVRIMGVRFVVDSYIYDQLRYPSVGDPPFGRRYATPLDLVAAFGSDLAYRIMDEQGDLTDPDTGESWTNYDDQLTKLTTMIAERGSDEWAATVYDAWLYALEPVWTPLGEAYPGFMQTDSWERKDLQTGLGSYTELKHDTVLYAKQSFAAEGDFVEPEYPEPRHWVEPNPVAFRRMNAVVSLIRDGLTNRDLLPGGSSNAALLDSLDAFLSRLARIAGDELQAKPLSTADNEWLGSIGSTIEALWIRSADPIEDVGQGFPNEDLNSALAVDIMRTTYSILQIATGRWDALFVMVPADDGRWQIARGGVYSYYEFWRDADLGRLTDQEWWELLASEPPDRPAWQSPLFSGGAPYAVGVPVGRSCANLEPYGYEAVVAYWLAYGRPTSLDPDRNGIPCDELLPGAFLAGLPSDTDLFCRDLEPDGLSFARAVAYWIREGMPDRMDADRNGIPCETVYPIDEIEEFFALEN